MKKGIKNGMKSYKKGVSSVTMDRMRNVQGYDTSLNVCGKHRRMKMRQNKQQILSSQRSCSSRQVDNPEKNELGHPAEDTKIYVIYSENLIMIIIYTTIILKNNLLNYDLVYNNYYKRYTIFYSITVYYKTISKIKSYIVPFDSMSRLIKFFIRLKQLQFRFNTKSHLAQQSWSILPNTLIDLIW